MVEMTKIFRDPLALLTILTIGVLFAGVSPATAQRDEVRERIFIHYPKPNHGGTNCQVTTDDTRTTYGLGGWHLSSSGHTYKVNYGTVPSSIAGNINTILDQATGTWTAADPDKTFTRAGATSASRARFDGTNLIAWGNVPSGAIGVTYVWYFVATGQLAEADMIFNRRLRWSWSNTSGDCVLLHNYDVQNIATHEFGHVAGLDDLYDPLDKDLTMYGFGALGELKKNTLGPGDTLGANAVAP